MIKRIIIALLATLAVLGVAAPSQAATKPRPCTDNSTLRSGTCRTTEGAVITISPARRLTVAYPNGAKGSWTPATAPACTEEDGSNLLTTRARVCRWDAATMGNGEGTRRYYVVRSTKSLVYVTIPR